MSGACSASSTIACTTTWSKCSPARRKTGSSANGKACDACAQKIEQEIRERGPIPFSRYMELCLYDPELGYYSRNAEQFGKAGDFYTSSDVHAVFGRLLARQFEEMWRVLGSPEQDRNSGAWPGPRIVCPGCAGLVGEEVSRSSFAALHYSLAERSPALCQRLEVTLSKHFRSGKVSLAERLKPPSSERPNGTAEAVPSHRRFLGLEAPVIVFANEFFDALPVEVLSPQGELRNSEKDGRLFETWHPPSARSWSSSTATACIPKPESESKLH